MDILEWSTDRHYNFEHVNQIARDVADGFFSTVGDMVKVTSQSISGFIEAMLEPMQSVADDVNPVELAERKRRKQHMRQNQCLWQWSQIFSPAHLRPTKTASPDSPAVFALVFTERIVLHYGKFSFPYL